jgi:hypothetical protein
VAIQERWLDCFVAALLAMTAHELASKLRCAGADWSRGGIASRNQAEPVRTWRAP